jgi:serine/threonine-protein phosphatase 5
MENYGLAIEDANEAIKVNPSFIKAYYRKGTAYLMMGKLNEARDSFVVAKKLTGGKDKDVLEKLNQIKKAIYEREFAKSIANPDEKSIGLDDIMKIDVPSSYDGPRIDGEEVNLTPEW